VEIDLVNLKASWSHWVWKKNRSTKQSDNPLQISL
jgi:hypothetical protein